MIKVASQNTGKIVFLTVIEKRIHCIENKAEFLLETMLKVDSRWIKDINVKVKTIKLLLENTGKSVTQV